MNRLLSKLKKIPAGAKSAGVYTLSSVFTRGLAILTVPIFTRLMPTEEIGLVNLYNSWYALLSVFATLSLTSGGFAVAMKEYAGRRDEYQSSVLSLTSLTALCLAGVYALAPGFWQKTLGLPNGLIVLMLIGFLVAPARDFWLARQRYEYKYRLAGAVSVLTAVLASLLSVLAVLRIGATASVRLFVHYAVVYGAAGVIWICLMAKGKKTFQREYWKMSLAVSLPLVGYNLAGQVLNVSDRMMISRMVGNSAVGIYGTLYTVSSLSLMVWQAINASFVPHLFQHMEKRDGGIRKISGALMEAYACVAVGLTWFAPEIVKILATEEYYEAIYIMPPIAAGVFFTSFANLYSNLAVYYKKTKYVMYPAVAAAACNVALNFVFIRLFGYPAAAYTTLFSYMLLAGLQALWSGKVCRENGTPVGEIYDGRKMLLLAALTTGGCLAGIPLYAHPALRYLLLLAGAAAAFAAGRKMVLARREKSAIIK